MFALALFTYTLVCVTWVFFRASSFADAFRVTTAMFGAEVGGGLALAGSDIALVLLINIGLFVGHFGFRHRTLESIWDDLNGPVRVAALTAMILAIISSPVDDRAFIYFQF